MSDTSQGAGPEPTEPADFDELMDRFTAAIRNGESPSIEDFAERHPEHAEPIRELFPTIQAMETLKSSSTPARPQLSFQPGDVLGDFEIVREIGRGGMGVVYEAVQSSLQRNIALKVLPALDDERRVKRFEREARTAAALHHTNIVPIFGVGEQEGWHYYVMPIVRGASLDRIAARVGLEREGLGTAKQTSDPVSVAVRSMRAGVFPGISSSSAGSASDSAATVELSPPPRELEVEPSRQELPDLDSKTWWRSIARIGVQVAEALAYAHAAGVLHRDIKPANLLVDDDGVVWVTDFGLATAREVDGLTKTGDVLGTVQYLAPEQLHGQADERSDLFGLGLTLYELCTGRPARGEGDRAELLRRAAEMRPERPSSLAPSIPRDLETILLKAIENEPRHRYHSAAALAEDLERFLEDRPILARRVSVFEAGARWCRRNKLVASLAALALIGVVGGGTASVIGWINASANARRAETLLEQAYEGFDEVAAALCGIESIALGDEAEEDGSSSESSSIDWRIRSLSPREQQTARTLLSFYKELEAEVVAGARASTAARAARRLGDLHRLLRDFDEARVNYEEALQRYEQLPSEEYPEGQDPTLTKAVILGRLARVEFLAAFSRESLERRARFSRRLPRRTRDGDAEQLGRASAVVERLRNLLAGESGVQARFELALAERLEALIDRELGDPRAAMDHLAEAHTLLEQLSLEQPNDLRYLTEAVEAGASWLRERLGIRGGDTQPEPGQLAFENALRATCDRVRTIIPEMDLETWEQRRLIQEASKAVMDLELVRRQRGQKATDVLEPWRAMIEGRNDLSRNHTAMLKWDWLAQEVRAVYALEGIDESFKFFADRMSASGNVDMNSESAKTLREMFKRLDPSARARPPRESGGRRPPRDR